MGSRLPSEKILCRQSLTTVFNFEEPGCDAIDLGVVSEQQPEMFDFLQHSDLDPFTIASVQWACDSDGAINCDISVTSNDNSLSPPILLPMGTGTYDSTLHEDGFFDATTPTGDSSIAALYKMNELVRTGCSRVDVYKEVCQIGGKVFDYSSDNDPDGQLCGHMDGGSMVNTCHRSTLFWGRIHPFILQVADKFEHHAQGWGYILVPSDTTYGYTEVHCLYTPTLEAVILSPDYSGKFLHCRGYVSVSNFDGQGCGVTLRHCQRSSQDIHFPLTQVRGLLFTGPLLLLLTNPSPFHNKLHVERIELDDDTAPTNNTNQPCACSHTADDNHHCPEHVCLPCGASSQPPVPTRVPRTCPCSTLNSTDHGAEATTRSLHASVPSEPSLAQTYSNVLWHECLGFQSDVAVDRLACDCTGTGADARMPTATPDASPTDSSPPETGRVRLHSVILILSRPRHLCILQILLMTRSVRSSDVQMRGSVIALVACSRRDWMNTFLMILATHLSFIMSHGTSNDSFGMFDLLICTLVASPKCTDMPSVFPKLPWRPTLTHVPFALQRRSRRLLGARRIPDMPLSVGRVFPLIWALWFKRLRLIASGWNASRESTARLRTASSRIIRVAGCMANVPPLRCHH